MKTAIHEAGHAVAHARLGIDQARVTVVADDRKGTMGYVLAACEASSEEEARRQVLAYCAGYAAVVASGSDPEAATEGCDLDFETARALLEFWTPAGALEDSKADAVRMMSTAENRKAVAVVADYLERHQAADADVVDVLIELADGQCTAEEFDRFLLMRSKVQAFAAR